MRHPTRQPLFRAVRNAGLALLGVALIAAPTMADGRHHDRHDRHVAVKHVHHAKVRHPAVRPVPRHGVAHLRPIAIPVVLRPAALATYEPYRQGQVYYGPHRHYHAVYGFPVHTANGWVDRPHDYCGADLFRSQVTYHGPRVRLRVNF